MKIIESISLDQYLKHTVQTVCWSIGKNVANLMDTTMEAIMDAAVRATMEATMEMPVQTQKPQQRPMVTVTSGNMRFGYLHTQYEWIRGQALPPDCMSYIDPSRVQMTAGIDDGCRQSPVTPFKMALKLFNT